MNELTPREILERTLHYWWIIVLLALLGGSAGWLFNRFRPPIYEASTVFEVSLDQQQLVRDGLVPQANLPLSETDQQVYLSPAADIFFAPEVKANLIAAAQLQDIALQQNTFSSPDFHLDRQTFRWFVTVRSSDPAKAADLANLWVAAAYPVLLEARAHTAESQSLGLQRDSVQKCFSEMDFAAANRCAGTSFAGTGDLDAYLNHIGQEINSKKQTGRGVDPALGFVIGNPAEPPSTPILYSVSLVILAGSLVGLLAGALVASVLPSSVHPK